MHESCRMRIRNYRCLLLRIVNVKPYNRQGIHPRRTSQIDGELVSFLVVKDRELPRHFRCRSQDRISAWNGSAYTM